MAALILYLTTGVIPGFTNELSVGAVAAAEIACVCNLIFLVKCVNTLEAAPFPAYIISTLFFLAVNANYIVAVVRSIDVSTFSTTFILNIVLFLAAAAAFAISFLFNNKG